MRCGIYKTGIKMITIEKISHGNFPNTIIKESVDAKGNSQPFATVEDALIYAEHNLYAYRVVVDGVPVDHTVSRAIVAQLKSEKKISY